MSTDCELIIQLLNTNSSQYFGYKLNTINWFRILTFSEISFFFQFG